MIHLTPDQWAAVFIGLVELLLTVKLLELWEALRRE